MPNKKHLFIKIIESQSKKTMSLARKGLMVAVIGNFLFLSCQNVVYIGNSQKGFKKVTNYKISPQQALELAKPHLALSYKLRSQNRNYKSDRPLVDHIIMTGPWYHIARDNYPYKTMHAYLKHAVQIHAQTGRVVPPE